jgi:hypothetical protein
MNALEALVRKPVGQKFVVGGTTYKIKTVNGNKIVVPLAPDPRKMETSEPAAAAAATTASPGDAGTGVPILLGTAEGWERAHRTGLLEKLETGVKGGEQPGELEALGDMRAGTPNFRDTSLPSTSSGPHDGAFGQPNPRELQRRKKSRVEDGSRFFRRPSLGVAATQPSDVASPRLRSTSSDEPAVAHAQQTSQQYEDDFAKRERNEARSPIARKTPKGSWAHANKGGGLRKQLIRELKTRDRENI